MGRDETDRTGRDEAELQTGRDGTDRAGQDRQNGPDVDITIRDGIDGTGTGEWDGTGETSRLVGSVPVSRRLAPSRPGTRRGGRMEGRERLDGTEVTVRDETNRTADGTKMKKC